ncbi:MAG: CoA ester lyase, partial [Desulfobacteraceae bacterium]|nr:CoA ester lyase [Desulfobacteraceae bacterium]
MKPTRSVLSVPGHRETMHVKAAASRADAVMLDLEDSVPLEEKTAARSRIVESLKRLDWGQKTVTFRINAVDTSLGYRDLLEVAEAAGDRIDAVVIPKIEDPGDVHFAARLLSGVEKSRGWKKPIGIEASIETAAG